MIPLSIAGYPLVPDAPQGTWTTTVGSSSVTLSESDTRLVFTDGINGWAKAKIVPVTHDFSDGISRYFEVHINQLTEHTGIGVSYPTESIALSWGSPPENAGQSSRRQYFSAGDKRYDNWSPYGPGWGAGDKIGIGLKVIGGGNLEMHAFKNGVDLGVMFIFSNQLLCPALGTWLPANDSLLALDISIPSRKQITLPVGYTYW